MIVAAALVEVALFGVIVCLLVALGLIPWRRC